MMLSRVEMIEICRANDTSYDGMFFLAVSSTGIYCLPSCPARFPKEENISFYMDRSVAEAAGYRGCLRCHSAEYQFLPNWVPQLLEYLHDNVGSKLRMSNLEDLTGRHRSTISTQFADQYGMTPLEYHRQLKLDTAINRIKQGEDYRDVAFALGYESVSGFRSAFKDQFNTTPGQLEVHN